MILLVLPEAERDLAEARDWYDARRPGLGDEFLEAIGQGLREVEQNPERVPLYYRNFRRVMLRRFPYKIFYQVLGDRGRVSGPARSPAAPASAGRVGHAIRHGVRPAA